MFPGGKGKAYQHIINLMPPHETYVEPFLGAGAVLRNKLPAKNNIANDIDLKCISEIADYPNISIHEKDAFEVISSLPSDGKTLIYCDPPYLWETRKQKKIYKFEYSDLQHESLLKLLIAQKCMVMISGYMSELYQDYLKNWNVYSFTCQSQVGKRQEHIWYNYEPPTVLHDSRYIGKCFRERQTIKRRQERLKKKFLDMDPIERSAFLDWLYTEFSYSGGRYE